ncbi:hypothetical protein KFL_001730030 [Klebsormidium nitens]|uniref:Uncharacterized protein n=1 Tax=Klebsormidium nitens TaxID=105231 RepID=A0A1Y1I7C3_KLENI|nr:hypothetical protein KFL_001730030 [Klebsormidium nitens]|eukprot:GAQ84008.1 hypothetical protein KFL_001730030 [Klebsormidium nitens]
MSKPDLKPSFPDLGFEEPHTPPHQEAHPSNLRSAEESEKRFSRPARLPFKQRALLRRATSQYFAEKQLVKDLPTEKQGPESPTQKGAQERPGQPAKKLSFREAAQVLGDFEAQKHAVMSPEEGGAFFTEQEADSSRITNPEQVLGKPEENFHKLGVSTGLLADSHVSEPVSGIVPERNGPSAVGSLSVVAGKTGRRSPEADNQPFNLPTPELFDLPERNFPVIRRTRASAPPGYSGSESEDDVTEQYRGSQRRSVGPPRSMFHERLCAYEALNWESPEELEPNKALGELDERRVSAEGRLTGGEYRGPGGTDRRAKFATVGARASAAYDIRGSPVSDTRARLVDQENVSLIDRHVNPRDVTLTAAESPGVRSARALRSIYSGLSRDKEPASGVPLKEADPRNPAQTTDLSFELWRPESVVRVIGKTNREEEPGAESADETLDSAPGADVRQGSEVEKSNAKRVSFGAVGSARVRAARPAERAGLGGLPPEAKWAAIQKSLKDLHSDPRAGGGLKEEKRGLEVDSKNAESRKVEGGVSVEGRKTRPVNNPFSNGRGERNLNVAFGSLFYPSQSVDTQEVEDSVNPYDDERDAEKTSGDWGRSIEKEIPRRSAERAAVPKPEPPVRTSSYFSRKGLELDDRGQPVGVGANYRSLSEEYTGQEQGLSAGRNNRSPERDRRRNRRTESETGTETDLAQSIAELAGNREWRSHENYLTPEAEIRGAQKSAKGLGDERETSQALAGRVGGEESVWVATRRGGKRSVLKGWAGAKRSMKKAVVWLGLKSNDKKMAINLERRPTLHGRAASLDADSDPEPLNPAPVARPPRGAAAIKRLWRRITGKLAALSARASRAEEARASDVSGRPASSGWASRVAQQAAARSGLTGGSRRTERNEGTESDGDLAAAPSGAMKKSPSTTRGRSPLHKNRVVHGGRELLKAPQALETNKTN